MTENLRDGDTVTKEHALAANDGQMLPTGAGGPVDTPAQPAPEAEPELFLGREQHEAAKLYDLMEGDEFDVFCKALAKIGLASPIVLHEGKVLEGRNRCRAIERLRAEGHQIEPTFVDWEPKGDETPYDYVLAVNGPRRHQTTDQRISTACRYLPVLREQSKQRQQASQFKAGRSTEGNEAAKSSQSPRKRDSKSKNQNSTAGQLAAKCFITLHMANQVIALEKAVRQKKLPVSAIVEVANGTKISKVLARIAKTDQPPPRRRGNRQQQDENTAEPQTAVGPSRGSVGTPLNPANLWGRPLPGNQVTDEDLSADENEETSLVSASDFEGKKEQAWLWLLDEFKTAELLDVVRYFTRKLKSLSSGTTAGAARRRSGKAELKIASIKS